MSLSLLLSLSLLVFVLVTPPRVIFDNILLLLQSTQQLSHCSSLCEKAAEKYFLIWAACLAVLRFPKAPFWPSLVLFWWTPGRGNGFWKQKTGNAEMYLSKPTPLQNGLKSIEWAVRGIFIVCVLGSIWYQLGNLRSMHPSNQPTNQQSNPPPTQRPLNNNNYSA